MAFSLFGFEFARKEKENKSFVPPTRDDGAVQVADGFSQAAYVDFEGSIKTEAENINKYREVAQHPEVEAAIDDIINEMIVDDPKKSIVKPNLDKIKPIYSNKFKDKITEEFENVISLLDFNNNAYELAKKWYIDGRLLYHAIVDPANPKEGIKELRYIDPRKIRKVRHIRLKPQPDMNGNPAVTATKEYYIYNERGFNAQGVPGTNGFNNNAITGLRIAKDSIVHVTSGLTDVSGSIVLSYLHKAIKPLNQLRVMEDALVIYRISRAPERRVFYIDVGSLPKLKAEQYVRDMMTKFKNRLVYNADTGEVKDERKYMTMLEDFWLPRRGGNEGDRGTKIDVLQGGQNLGELTDVEYFQKKLYKSLNVPQSRLLQETGFSLGRSTEISRDEVKFTKFIGRLRARFATLFKHILGKQLILKNIVTLEDWEEISQDLSFDFNQDDMFFTLLNLEILKERLEAVGLADAFVGKYYSVEYIQDHVMGFTDEEKQLEIKRIEEEAEKFMDAAAPDMENMTPGEEQIEQDEMKAAADSVPQYGPAGRPEGAKNKPKTGAKPPPKGKPSPKKK